MRFFVASLFVLAAFVPLFEAQECREYVSCLTCLADPSCGWCATTDACVPGNSVGPSTGTCSNWDWTTCSSSPITPSATPFPSSTPTPSPTPSPSPSPPPPAFTLDTDWPMFGGGPTHDGSRTRPDMEVAKAHLEWRGSYGSYSSASVLCDGMLLATIAPSNKATLSALDALTGDKLFTVALGDSSSFSPPACRDGVAYIQVIGGDEGIDVYAVNLTTASILWKSEGSSQWANYQYGVLPHPTNGLIYVPGGEYQGVMYAFNENGSKNYSKQLYSTGFGCDSWTPTAYGKEPNDIYWVTMPGEGPPAGLFGVNDALTGVSDWELNLPGDWDGYSTYSVVAVADEIALTSLRAGGISVQTIDLNKQDVIWNYTDCSSNSVPTGGFKDQSLSSDGKIAAMTCSDGILVFDLKTGNLEQNLYCPSCGGQPIITPKFFIASGGGSTFIVPRNGGSTYTLNAGGTVLISGTAVFVTDMGSGSIAAFQLLRK